jgi:hypothetical protein
MSKMSIKVGFLASYDWTLLYNSLPRIYNSADTIHIAIDKALRTWAGNYYHFDEALFFEFIDDVDYKKKVVIYKDNFFVEGLSPMQCEVRERNMLAKEMGEGGWHIQLDADEYFLNFHEFVKYLYKLQSINDFSRKGINVNVNWIQLFKKVEFGYIYISQVKQIPENVPIATNRPLYEAGRRNGYFNHISPFYIVHDTWARSEKEIQQKIFNWGHKYDFDTEKYFDFWKNISQDNYQEVSNFHPIHPSTWKRLSFQKAQDINEFIDSISIKFPLSSLELFAINNRNIARIRYLYHKILK